MGLTRAGVFGVWAAGVQSVSAPIVGVHMPCATSLFDRVMVVLGGVQMGCKYTTGLASRWHVGMGLAKGDRGWLKPLGHPFTLGLMSEAGECNSFMPGAVSPVIWFVIGS